MAGVKGGVPCRAATWLVAAAAICCAARAEAGFLGGEELYQLCDSNNIIERSLCESYIMGVIDATVRLLPPNDSGRFCLPDHSRMRDVEPVVRSYLKTKPDRRDSPAEILIAAALRERFPCPR
jgi:hypothetical protein